MALSWLINGGYYLILTGMILQVVTMAVTPLVGPNVNFVVFELVAHLIHITSLSLRVDEITMSLRKMCFVSFFSGKNIDLLEGLAEFPQTLTLKRRGLLRSL